MCIRDSARVLARAKRNMPPVIGQAAGEDVKQGGLARAVRAQNGDLFPWLDICLLYTARCV